MSKMSSFQKKIFILFILLVQSCLLKSLKENTVDDIIDESAENLRKQILKSYTIKEKKTIAIASFARTDLIKPNAKYYSVIPKLGILYANALQNEMFQPERFDLLERQRIDGLLNEIYYDKIGISEESHNSLKLSGADYILLGTLQRREKSIRIDARLVGTLDGKIVSVGTATLPINQYILQLYNDFPESETIFKVLVYANHGWQSISELSANSEITIEAEGEWSMTSHPVIRLDAKGSESNPSRWGDFRLYEDFNHGALICRMNTEPSFIMTLGTWKVEKKGILECRINDTDLQNNIGTQTVIVKVKKLEN